MRLNYLSVLRIRANPIVIPRTVSSSHCCGNRFFLLQSASSELLLDLFAIPSMGTSEAVPKEQEPRIHVKSLSYAFHDGSTGLQEVTLSLPQGSRTLLIGGIWSPSCLSVHSHILSLTCSSQWRWEDHTAPPPVRQTNGSYRHSQHRWD